MTNRVNAGLLILRVLIGGLFLWAGIGKLGATPEIQEMIGGAGHMMGLTFLSKVAWFHIATRGEIIGGLMLILGLCTRVGAIILFIVCVFMVNMMGRNFDMMSQQNAFYQAVLGVIMITLFLTGGGKWSLCNAFGCALCKNGECDCCESCSKDQACKCCKAGCKCGDCDACK